LSLAAGEVYWAIVPYTPSTPFKIHVADGGPVEVPTATQIVDGLRKGGDVEFEFVVRAKARPVLLLSGRSDPRTGDLFALRLLRLGKLPAEERQRVEEQREPSLFHLPPERFPDLGEASVAMVTAPIRLHETALDTRKALGRLDRNEMRVLVERFVSYWQFDLRQLLVAQIRELQHRRWTHG
jgi:hypothetical protein